MAGTVRLWKEAGTDFQEGEMEQRGVISFWSSEQGDTDVLNLTALQNVDIFSHLSTGSILKKWPDKIPKDSFSLCLISGSANPIRSTLWRNWCRKKNAFQEDVKPTFAVNAITVEEEIRQPIHDS